MKTLPSVSFPCLKSVFIVKFSPLIFFLEAALPDLLCVVGTLFLLLYFRFNSKDY